MEGAGRARLSRSTSRQDQQTDCAALIRSLREGMGPTSPGAQSRSDTRCTHRARAPETTCPARGSTREGGWGWSGWESREARLAPQSGPTAPVGELKDEHCAPANGCLFSGTGES